jgi:dTDP-4-dehydrorhamnose reductase
MQSGGQLSKPILLLGGNGQVGWELRRTLAALGPIVVATRAELDLCDINAIVNFVRTTQPELIVNAAAYTAVDRGEDEPDIATAVNGVAPGILAEEAKKLHCPMIHFSTDYVFDGTITAASATPNYSEETAPNPLNVYGKSKLAGERAVQQVGGSYLILRTSWVYANRGNNFLRTILRLAQENDTLRIVDDQVGCPTWARMIAEGTAGILARIWRRGIDTGVGEHSGVYHLAASGEASWHQFAEAIVLGSRDRNLPGICASKVLPIPSSEYPTHAIRPSRTVLNCLAADEKFAISLPDWRTQLQLCLDEYVEKQ